MEDQVENQVNDWINSFGEFFAGYSSEGNQHAIVITSRHNTYLFLGDIIKLSSDISHTLLEKDLFRELSNSDLLEFTCQKVYELSNIEKI